MIIGGIWCYKVEGIQSTNFSYMFLIDGGSYTSIKDSNVPMR
jgi:hypothetical protein